MADAGQEMKYTAGLRIDTVLLILIFFYVLRAEGQSARNLQFIKPDNGLSHRNVFSILQDRQGYMWFGTENGLNRYDASY
jgi:ligand-binding sensor domain-containing protein